MANIVEQIVRLTIDGDETKAKVIGEVKHGKWKQGYCSECGYYWGKDAPIASVPNFCPNCGADIRKETEDGRNN